MRNGRRHSLLSLFRLYFFLNELAGNDNICVASEATTLFSSSTIAFDARSRVSWPDLATETHRHLHIEVILPS